MAKLFMNECVWSLCYISCLFFSVSFVSSNFHPNQASISHFLLILLLPQPIIISPLCFSVSPTLFLTLDLYLSVISLLSCAVSLCLIWFSFSKSCLKKSRYSVGVPNKLVACTFIPQKNKKKNIYKMTHLPAITGSFFFLPWHVKYWQAVDRCIFAAGCLKQQHRKVEEPRRKETEVKKQRCKNTVENENQSASEWGVKE